MTPMKGKEDVVRNVVRERATILTGKEISASMIKYSPSGLNDIDCVRLAVVRLLAIFPR